MGLTKRNRSKNLPERLPCVPTFDTVCALRTLPPEAEETLADAVRLEAEAISPFEEGAYTFSYEVIRRRAEGIDVLVAAASDAVLDGHGHDLLREAGLLGALRLDLSALAWARALTERRPDLRQGLRPVLVRAPGEQLLLALSDGVPVAVRGFAPDVPDTLLAREATMLLARLGMESGMGELGAGLCLAETPEAAAPLRDALGQDPEFAPLGAEEAEAALQRGLRLRAEEAGATFDLTPQAWRDEAHAARQKTALVVGGSVLGAAWLICALTLFLLPRIYGKLAADVTAELNAQRAAYEEVLALRERVTLIERYQDRSHSALEMLRLLCEDKAENVVFLSLTYRQKQEVRVTGLADDTSDVYRLKDELQKDPRIATVNINRLTQDAKTRRQRFDIEILFPTQSEGSES